MKRGFTLVELLAVIALIGILITISIPAYNNIKKKAAERTLENKIDMLEVAAYNYGNDNINNVKSNPSLYQGITIVDLIESGYLTSDSDERNILINPVTGAPMTEVVQIIYEDYKIKVQILSGVVEKYTLTINLNGGTWDENNSLLLGEKDSITLGRPTKAYYTFTGWVVSSGNDSQVDGSIFTMGSGDAVITAQWSENYYTLTVNLNGGTWDGDTSQSIKEGATTTILNPTKAGYYFNGWTVAGTGSSINGTTFTMGTKNATLTARWLSYDEMFVYTVGGSNGTPGTDYSVLNDGSGNWRIKFLNSGTFTPLTNMLVDVFLVGGGGGGGLGSTPGTTAITGGAGSGYTTTRSSISLTANTSYPITIGSGGAINNDGGASTAFTYSAAGGSRGGIIYYTDSGTIGGNGGSGGGGCCTAGGSDGSNGLSADNKYGGTGQGTTTREFGESSGTIYAYGGAGTDGWGTPINPPTFIGNNTGTGGNGRSSGYSGIIIIRNHR